MNKGSGGRACRSCLEPQLFMGLDLGILPISNELMSSGSDLAEEFPLELFICSNCLLGQVSEVVYPDRLFSDYRYLTSVSTTFVEHAKSFCESAINRGLLEDGDFVLEIACNDGYLLKNFLGTNFRTLGIEPAVNVARRASELGIPVINEFFGSDLASKIVKEFGHPRLVIANNVLAHVPDIRDFMLGLSILCDSQTIISVENPSILNILSSNQFDTIYHEHYSYLSCHSVSNLAKFFDLNLFDVESLTTHGGSNRYWIQKKVESESQRLLDALELEVASGIADQSAWRKAQEKMEQTLSDLKTWFNEKSKLGELVVGYGAAAKASTLLNSARIGLEELNFICDKSEEKVGRFMPRANYEITTYSKLLNLNPDHILVFPWNISEEINSALKLDLPNCEVWVAIPYLRKLTS
jgi:hypothetical protein